MRAHVLVVRELQRFVFVRLSVGPFFSSELRLG